LTDWVAEQELKQIKIEGEPRLAKMQGWWYLRRHSIPEKRRAGAAREWRKGRHTG